jgi:hypothetical protein
VTPAERIARAKRLALLVKPCVDARVRPDHLREGLSEDDLWALVIVMAEAADPVTLREVAEAPDGYGDPVPRELTLRKAHAEVRRLRVAGKAVPFHLRVLDNEYRERRRELRGAATPGGAPENQTEFDLTCLLGASNLVLTVLITGPT